MSDFRAIPTKSSAKGLPMRGEIYQGDFLIGRFHRENVGPGLIGPLRASFFSERRRNALMDEADCLTMGEIIEAIMELQA